MKYPMEYWTGRMSGVLQAIAKHGADDDVRGYCKKLVEDFEKDYRDDEVRDNDLHNSGYDKEETE